jgi:hypothetical protein
MPSKTKIKAYDMGMKIGINGMTAREIAALNNVSLSTATKWASAQVGLGAMRIEKVRRKRVDGVTCIVPAYIPTKST